MRPLFEFNVTTRYGAVSRTRVMLALSALIAAQGAVPVSSLADAAASSSAPSSSSSSSTSSTAQAPQLKPPLTAQPEMTPGAVDHPQPAAPGAAANAGETAGVGTGSGASGASASSGSTPVPLKGPLTNSSAPAVNPALSPDPTIATPGKNRDKDKARARKLTSTVYLQELKIQSLEPGGTAPRPKAPESLNVENPYGDKPFTDAMEQMPLQTPELKALVTINRQMDPFGLDASSSRVVSLRQVLDDVVQHNLAIQDSRAQTQVQKYTYYNTLTGFLPDASFTDNNIWATGKINLPLGNAFGSQSGNSSVSSKAVPLKIHGPFYILGGSVNYSVFQGGKVVFGSLRDRHNYRAQTAQQRSTLQDALLDGTRQYYNLILQQALLQNQIRAVATDEEQFRQNSDLEKHGLATYLDVLQAKTQLAKDRQNLIDQQTSRRTAAIKLADLLNANLGEDLIPLDQVVKKVRLVDPSMPIAQLLRLAIDNRPELRQYEELRMAAKRNIVVQGSSLWPQAKVGGGVYGIGAYSLGTIYFLNFSVNWMAKGMGTNNLTNIQKARWQARQSLIQANKELITVLDQVRTSLLETLSAEKKIEETTEEVASAVEELRLARLRFEHGLGTNLDVLTGQRDLTAAYIDKATAIVNYNISQVQLLHDIGLISVDTATSAKVLR